MVASLFCGGMFFASGCLVDHRIIRGMETSPEQTAVNLGQEAVSLAQEDVRPIEVVRAIVARVDENTDAATAAAREAKRAAAEVNFALNVVIDLANSANQILYFVRFADISRATESVAQRTAELKSIVDKVKFVNVFAVKAVEAITSAAATASAAAQAVERDVANLTVHEANAETEIALCAFFLRDTANSALVTASAAVEAAQSAAFDARFEANLVTAVSAAASAALAEAAARAAAQNARVAAKRVGIESAVADEAIQAALEAGVSPAKDAARSAIKAVRIAVEKAVESAEAAAVEARTLADLVERLFNMAMSNHADANIKIAYVAMTKARECVVAAVEAAQSARFYKSVAKESAVLLPIEMRF